MSSRITSSMLTSNYLLDMKRNLNNMQTLQSQLSSGNEIEKPSDNPYKALRSMQIHTEIAANEQYNENIKDIGNWLDTTDTALSQAGTVFSRIEYLLDRTGNASYTDTDRIAIQDEVKIKVEELAQILNTNFDGAYIFGGTKVTSKPLTVVNGEIQYADSDGNEVTITAYKDSNGKISKNTGAANTQINLNVSPLTTTQKEDLITERDDSNTTKERREDITKMLQGGDVYTTTGGKLTSEKYVNKEITLSATEITNLQTELNELDYSVAANNTRISEINDLLYDNSGTATVAGKLKLSDIRTNQETIKSATTTSAQKKDAIDALNGANKVISVNQTNSQLNVDISQGVSTIYNKSAIEVMEFTDKNGKSINVSDLLTDIIRNLSGNGDTKQLIGDNLRDIQSVTANLLKKRAEVGAMQNRMDSAKENNEKQNYNMTDILSKTQDIDITEKTMEFAIMKTIYSAALQTSAKVLPQTILNYL